MTDTVDFFLGFTKAGVDGYTQFTMSAENAALIGDYLAGNPQYNRKRKTDDQMASELAAIEKMNTGFPGGFPMQRRVNPFTSTSASPEEITYNLARAIGEKLIADAQVALNAKAISAATADAVKKVPVITSISIADISEPTKV